MIHYRDNVLEEKFTFDDWDELQEQMHHDFLEDRHALIDVLIGARKMGRWTGDIEAFLDVKITED